MKEITKRSLRGGMIWTIETSIFGDSKRVSRTFHAQLNFDL